MPHLFSRGCGRCLAALAGAAVMALAGCSSPYQRAPVEDRGTASRLGASATAQEAKPLPGAENAGKPGYYTVKAGDTVTHIALDNGQSPRDIVRWNNLDNPNVIEVGQVLRVVPPGTDPGVAAARPVPAAPRVETRPLETRPAAPWPAPATASAGTAASAASAAVVPPVAATPQPAKEADDDINWMWPAAGTVIGNFDEARNVKGLLIGGKAGDPVYAAADGRVVYAGSGLRGYGQLIIIKHNTSYLTTYGHNQLLLVKDDQVVRRGQKIAEMGSTDADRVQLYFEIRRRTRPMDPAKLLPAR